MPGSVWCLWNCHVHRHCHVSDITTCAIRVLRLLMLWTDPVARFPFSPRPRHRSFLRCLSLDLETFREGAAAMVAVDLGLPTPPHLMSGLPERTPREPGSSGKFADMKPVDVSVSLCPGRFRRLCDEEKGVVHIWEESGVSLRGRRDVNMRTTPRSRAPTYVYWCSDTDANLRNASSVSCATPWCCDGQSPLTSLRPNMQQHVFGVPRNALRHPHQQEHGAVASLTPTCKRIIAMTHRT